jgi:ADP-heptose:LPS heptosyltransferase
MNSWKRCRKMLCVRLDNMGDVLMSSPAFIALRESFGCRITLLTSSMGAPIAPYLPAIDEVLVFDSPWVKRDGLPDPESLTEVVATLKQKNFDAAVIFTAFSQNPLPAALLLYQAKIPRTLAYCRENPYMLLTDWVPEKEPYDFIRHQVIRDLDLVKEVGACVKDERLHVCLSDEEWPDVKAKVESTGADLVRPWLIFHPGVSEVKRQYSTADWISIGQAVSHGGYKILLTGTAEHVHILQEISAGIGNNCIVMPTLSLHEFMLLVKHAPLVVTVNTVTAHIAAAVQTQVIVLYAETNPQHTPWNVPSRIFTFPVADSLQSKNEVLKYVTKNFLIPGAAIATPGEISQAVLQMMTSVLEEKRLVF